MEGQMKFLIVDKMQDRVKVAKENSDTSYFFDLMYLGEMILKIVTLGLVTAIENDSERHQYIQEYRLVRANGIGEWVSVIEETLLGPTRNYLANGIQDIVKEMTMKSINNSWQYDCVQELVLCLNIITNNNATLTSKVNLLTWFAKFSSLRNATRGHGAILDNQCG
jgi:hypothetical protein